MTKGKHFLMAILYPFLLIISLEPLDILQYCNHNTVSAMMLHNINNNDMSLGKYHK